MTSFRDPATLWEFDYQVIPGSGLVLQNVLHAAYWFGKDIRLVGVWAGSEDPSTGGTGSTAPQLLQLGDMNFPSQAVYPPQSYPVQPPAAFPYYSPLVGLFAEFKTSLPAFGGDLTVKQEFQFARYGMNPPHEPGGVLPAARLLPLTYFTFQRNVSGGPGLAYLRFDYRMNVDLGDVVPPGFGEEITYYPPRISAIASHQPHKSQAGVFRDQEGIPMPSGIGVPTLYDIFAGGEKPLQYEIIGRGLTHSKPEVKGKPATFDNVHVWPSPYPGGLPSTPGAFYSLHVHGRWGAVAGAVPTFPLTMLLPAAGQPQFKGLGWISQQGGPLLDRKLADQTLKFAITKNFGMAGTLTTSPFEDLFKRLRGKPESIKAGDDLVFWLSIEVFRPKADSRNDWDGTVFVHGMYFAHDPEPGLLSQAGLLGLQGELFKSYPDQTQAWERFAAPV